MTVTESTKCCMKGNGLFIKITRAFERHHTSKGLPKSNKFRQPCKTLICFKRNQYEFLSVFQRQIIIPHMFDFKTVLLKFLIIKSIQFIAGQFMEFIKIVPPFITIA